MTQGQQPELSVAEQRAIARKDERRPKLRERRYVDGEGHDLVVDDVRCDREWENAHADNVRKDWEDGRDDRLKQRQAQRRQMTDGQRLDHALMQIELGTGRRARRIEAASSTSDDRSPGGKRPTHVEGVDVEPNLRVIRHHLRAIEELLDAELGLISVPPLGRDHPGNVGGMATGRLTIAERRRIVWEDFQGIQAQQVADEQPYLATSARTVQRFRRTEGDLRKINVRLVDGVLLGQMSPEEARRADSRLLTPLETAAQIRMEQLRAA